MRLCWCSVLPSIDFKHEAATGRHTLSHINQGYVLRQTEKVYLQICSGQNLANVIDKDRLKHKKTLWTRKATLRLHGMDNRQSWCSWNFLHSILLVSLTSSLSFKHHLDVHFKLCIITLKTKKSIYHKDSTDSHNRINLQQSLTSDSQRSIK